MQLNIHGGFLYYCDCEVLFSGVELSILACISNGKSCTYTSMIIGLSYKSVESCIENIRHKLKYISNVDFINFLLKSENRNVLNKRYANILYENNFNAFLKNQKIGCENLKIMILCNVDDIEYALELKDDLESVGCGSVFINSKTKNDNFVNVILKDQRELRRRNKENNFVFDIYNDSYCMSFFKLIKSVCRSDEVEVEREIEMYNELINGLGT